MDPLKAGCKPFLRVFRTTCLSYVVLDVAQRLARSLLAPAGAVRVKVGLTGGALSGPLFSSGQVAHDRPAAEVALEEKRAIGACAVAVVTMLGVEVEPRRIPLGVVDARSQFSRVRVSSLLRFMVFIAAAP